ncbi:MAG: LysR family transcriptional regulator [Chitinophagales bacterium]|nr:LysR family transcriptional regulator [Hyphomicrobiales bacterium]
MLDLDIGLLRTFTVVAKLNSFTAAGELLGATQSAVSLRIAKLEDLAKKKLLVRTPRSVALTPDGVKFLHFAKATLFAHDAAVASLQNDLQPTTIRFAISDHAVGANLMSALTSLKASIFGIAPDVMVGSSSDMRGYYDAGEADVAIVRQDGDKHKGHALFSDPLVWAKSPNLDWLPGKPVPLIALRGSCGVKAAAVKVLDDARLPWRFAFLGGSVSALRAAVDAGLGIGAFGQRQVSPARRIGKDAGLPEMPIDTVILYSRLSRRVTDLIGAAFKAPGSATLD